MLPNGELAIMTKDICLPSAMNMHHYSPGNKKLIASVKGWKINLQVCYDLRFPVWARQTPGAEENKYDLMINVANWPEKRSTAWKTLLQRKGHRKSMLCNWCEQGRQRW